MVRAGIGFAAVVLAISMIAAPIDASAEPGKKAGAAAARAVAKPAVSRPAMVRPARAAAPRRAIATQKRAVPRIAAPAARTAPSVHRQAGRAATRALRQQQRAQQRQQQAAKSIQQNPRTAQQQRLQQLQSKRGRLTRAERRQLQQLRRAERRGLQRQERQAIQPQQQNVQPGVANLQRRPPRPPVSAQEVTRGRFASIQRAGGFYPNGRLAGRRAARLAARTAWQLGVLAPYIPWRGPVYWPYAYNDVFYYTFWPEAYDPGYWAYAYDDFFDGVFFPDGAPYAEYAAEGPYDGSYARGTTTGSAPPAAPAPGRVNQSTREFCADQARGVTAWPLQEISQAVRPTDLQRELLENLKAASAEAAAQFREACPDIVPLTPPGRLQAMMQRLRATNDAIKTVRPALQALYDSLGNEQRTRFNEIGPEFGKPASRNAASNPPQANCSSEKAGLSGIAINRIEEAVQPTAAQEATLDRLDGAMQKAVDALRDACPNTTPQTPVGRLEVMEKRLAAMIAAASTVRPALEDFYASLNDEQKAKFNRLGRQTAQSGG